MCAGGGDGRLEIKFILDYNPYEKSRLHGVWVYFRYQSVRYLRFKACPVETELNKPME